MPPSQRVTLESLERALTETHTSNLALREAVDLLKAAIFGRPNADPRQALPGIQADVSAMREQINYLAEKLSTTSHNVDKFRWWISGSMAAATGILAILDVLVRTHVAGFP